jgi:hypothetical protein
MDYPAIVLVMDTVHPIAASLAAIAGPASTSESTAAPILNFVMRSSFYFWQRNNQT